MKNSNGDAINDVIRFFHGDAPAQQFEAGHSIGGKYFCVGCGAQATLIDDIGHCYRRKQHSLEDRQKFVLTGKTWKKKTTAPFESLTMTELKAEVSARNITVQGKKKPELERDLEELRMGISRLPPLIGQTPLDRTNLSYYEICPI